MKPPSAHSVLLTAHCKGAAVCMHAAPLACLNSASAFGILKLSHSRPYGLPTPVALTFAGHHNLPARLSAICMSHLAVHAAVK